MPCRIASSLRLMNLSALRPVLTLALPVATRAVPYAVGTSFMIASLPSHHATSAEAANVNSTRRLLRHFSFTPSEIRQFVFGTPMAGT
jgi:hypothetical protein